MSNKGEGLANLVSKLDEIDAAADATAQRLVSQADSAMEAIKGVDDMVTRVGEVEARLRMFLAARTNNPPKNEG